MNKKIMPLTLSRAGILWGFLLIINVVNAQEFEISKYGLPYIANMSDFRKTLKNHSEKQMLPLYQINGLIMGLRYATPNNFTHRILYKEKMNTTFLRKPVALALDSASKDFGQLGFVMVVFDAYRPYAVTEIMWEYVKDDRYAANPATGSGHNRGVSVDVSLADMKTHKLIPMPTEFDNFSDSAHQDFNEIAVERRSNRDILKTIMTKYGFIPLTTEWWHFSWPHPERFEVLNLSFKQLQDFNR